MAEKLRSNSMNANSWWRILKGFIKPTASKTIPPLLDTNNNTLVFDPISKANLLNSFFQEQTLIDDSNNTIPAIPLPIIIPIIESIDIIPQEVLDVLKSLPIHKASGPDGISNKILVEIAKQIHIPLTKLFNKSLQCSKFPSAWKLANVCPILKKGDPSLPNNYRPISLLNCLEKAFERVIFKHVFNFLQRTNFFTKSQSGFLPQDSTTNQLVICTTHFAKLSMMALKFELYSLTSARHSIKFGIVA